MKKKKEAEYSEKGNNGYPYPDALEVVKVLQKIPRWAKELDEVRARVDDAEDPAKWTWV